MISARSHLLQLSKEDLADPSLKDKVYEFAVARGIDSAMITLDGKLMLCSSKKKLSFNSGVSTIQKQMHLQSVPTRLTGYDPLPNDFIVKHFPDGYDITIIYYSFGEKFKEEYINNIVHENVLRKKNREKNKYILSNDTTNLIENGTLSVFDIGRVEQAKQQWERIDNDRHRNKDLDGPFTFKFHHWTKTDKKSERPTITNDYAPVHVTVVGRPNQLDIKQKHYFIYSKLASFGKSYQLMQFAMEYNVQLVPDPSNWNNVSPCAQFLAFDEVGKSHNKLSFENLKSLTSGSAQCFTGNCKSFGNSFTPRPDVQVIMVSNKSPYELYSTWNAKLQKGFMNVEEMGQFDDRFYVFRLDGSVEEDRIKALEPERVTVEALNEDQFLERCKSVVDNAYNILKIERSIRSNVIWIEWVVDKIVKLCREREPERDDSAQLLLLTVLKDLDDGRLSPTLVDTFKMFYESVFMKIKGQSLENARRKLVCQETANETRAFGSRRLEDLARYLEENRTAVYRLHRFYADEPHSIDFSQKDDKEGVFRACLEVHSDNSATEKMDEVLYRSVVFDKVWKVANPQHGDGENEGQNVSRKRKRSSSSETTEDEDSE